MEMENDLRQVLNQVILHLPPAPDTTGYFLHSVAGVLLPGDAAGVGASASSAVRSSAPSVSSAGPLLPDEVCSPAPSVSSGSRRVISGDADVFTSSSSNVSSGAATVASADAGTIVTISGGSAAEGACFSVPPGDVCSSASGLPGALCSNAAPSYIKSTAGPVTCERRTLPEGAVRFIFRHLPIKSIFRVGYLFSKNWLEIWKGMPLVMHDIQLAPDHARVSLRDGDIAFLDLAKNVSQVIDLHPGPVELFRVDSCTWRGVNSLRWRVWLQKLINRNVKEVVICGRWPRSPMELLPNNLVHCKSLEKVHLCFFSLPAITDNLLLPCLQELELFHCVFDSSDLDFILRSCKLIKLTLGYVMLSTLRIQSETLSSFAMWSCNIDIICLSGTPSLTFFGQEPGWTWDHRSHIQVRGIPKLQVLLSIYLNQQTIELCGYLIKADMVDYPLCSSVSTLGLVVDFSYLEGLQLIPSLLRCFPKLRTLQISRVHFNEDNTVHPIDWHGMLSTIPCIKTNLNIFQLVNGHDDIIEENLAETVIGCAAALKEFQVELHPQYRSGTE